MVAPDIYRPAGDQPALSRLETDLLFFEGGIHVPYFMRWAARIKPGSRLETPVHHFDLFATAAGAAKAAMPTDRKMSGVNLLDFIYGVTGITPAKQGQNPQKYCSGSTATPTSCWRTVGNTIGISLPAGAGCLTCKTTPPSKTTWWTRSRSGSGPWQPCWTLLTNNRNNRPGLS